MLWLFVGPTRVYLFDFFCSGIQFYLPLRSFLCYISPCIDIVLIFFHNLVFQQYWVLTESRIPVRPVLGDVRIVALSISSHEQTQ